jgi:hypothetical protein
MIECPELVKASGRLSCGQLASAYKKGDLLLARKCVQEAFGCLNCRIVGHW